MTLRILFIDDELKILEGLQRSVRPLRNVWDARFANSGEQALQMLAESQFDAVVTDMRMPGMDGVAVLKAVMERHPHLLRIILSGYSDMESIIKSAGVAHQYLSKPCPIDQIKSAITRAFSLKQLLGSAELRTLLSGVDTIPSLPLLFSELTRLMNDPDSSMEQIAALVSRDLGMCAKVLQLVNSAFFGRRRIISDPSEAIRYLGLGTLRALALAVHVFKSFQTKQGSASFAKDLWDHSSEVSLVAEKVARLVCPGDRVLHDEAAMSGLLHDVGTLLLACDMRELYLESCRLAETEKIPMWKAERAVFKATHAEAGAYILAFWGLPHSIVEAIAYHHTPSACHEGKFSAVTAVHIAEHLTREGTAAAERNPGELDTQYLEEVGVVDRLNQFRAIVAEARAVRS